MQLALVLGSAVSTVKHPTMSGCKLLVAQPLAADGASPDGEPLLIVDTLGAGRGERILITNDGKAARELVKDETTPIRWTTIGIPDAAHPKSASLKSQI
jgi:ethanolamine utilization protein EutN